MKIQQSSIPVYFAFGEEWTQKPEFQGFVPSDGTNWRSLKEAFYARDLKDPQSIILTKGKTTIPVYVYGFRIPERPPVIALGSDATVGRVAFVQLSDGERVAIHY